MLRSPYPPIVFVSLLFACAGPRAASSVVAAPSPTPTTREPAPWLEDAAPPPPPPAERARGAIVPQRVLRESEPLDHVRFPGGIVALDGVGNLSVHDASGAVRISHRLVASVGDVGSIVGLSRDGKRVVVAAGAEGEVGLFVLALDADRVVRIAPPPGGEFFRAVTDADVTRIASVYAIDGDVRLRMYDAAGGTVCSSPIGFEPRELAFSSAGSLIAHARGDGLIRIDADTCENTRIGEEPMSLLVVRPGGGQVLTVERDTLVVRAASDGREIDRRPLPHRVTRIVYSEDGACFVVAGDHAMTAYRAGDGRVVHATRESRFELRSVEPGCHHVRTTGPRATARFDLATGESGEPDAAPGAPADEDDPVFPPGGFHSVWATVFDPARVRLFVGTRNEGVLVTATSAERHCDRGTEIVIVSGRPIANDQESPCDITDGSRVSTRVYATNTAGTHALVGTVVPNDEAPDDPPVAAWVQDLETGARGRALAGVGDLYRSSEEEDTGLELTARLSDDARFVTIGDYETGVKIFDARSGRRLTAIGPSDDGTDAFVVGDTGMLVVGGDDGAFIRALPRGVVRLLGEGTGLRGTTGSFYVLGGHDGDVPRLTFVDPRAHVERVVSGPGARILPGGHALAARDDDFDFVWLSSGRTQRYAGRFVAATRDGKVIVRCEGDVLRVHGLGTPIETDLEGSERGACVPEDARVTLRDDGRVLAHRGLTETMLVRLDDGTRAHLRVLAIDHDDVVVYVEDDAGVFVLSGDPAMLRRREEGPALTAALVPVIPSEETARRFRRLLEP